MEEECRDQEDAERGRGIVDRVEKVKESVKEEDVKWEIEITKEEKEVEEMAEANKFIRK